PGKKGDDAKEGLKIPEGTPPGQAFVQILDPATGTGTFLVEVIDVIHTTMVNKWKAQGHDAKKIAELWNDYVPKHLLPRLHGYELMMAPYAIAHMKIGLKLYETGYRFESDERARVYLTNSLEPPQDFSGHFDFDIPALAHEAQAVNDIKRRRRFAVVIGNPPYSNFGIMNKIPFILGLLEDYKRGLDEKKLNLDDDFIKFMRFAQWVIEVAGCGVVGVITNNTFIDGITHRQMRAAIRATFRKVYVLNLHGSSSKKETCPDGTKDENVFDIQQGVGVSLLVSKPTEHSLVSHADLWGVRDSKYTSLGKGSVRATNWRPITPDPPYHFFVPKDFRQIDEYSAYPSLTDIFSVNGPGVKTERDGVSIHWSSGELKQAVKAFKELSEAQLRAQFGLGPDSRDWKISSAKADVVKNDKPACYTQISYRPFDERHIWYSGQTRGFVGTPGFPVMQHMLRSDALGLLGMRQFEYDVPDYCYVFVSRFLIDNRVFVSNRGIANIFPLYTGGLLDAGQGSLLAHPKTNFKPAFLRRLCESLQLKESGSNGLPTGLTPEDIFHYVYAVFHSPGYRSRYAEFLKIDFPRLPLTGNLELLHALARLGAELTALHLLESPELNAIITTYTGPKSPEVRRVGWSNDTVWLDAGKTNAREGHRAERPGTIGFKGVPEQVWDFHIGGYQVCHKWLKDRQGRTLSDDDIAHYQKIVVALNETIRIMAEIDAVIDQHGGWPAAFQTG
ncbi:MAG: DNA methyltransferase, partial [Rhodopirellula sp.]|nr:DNA methyltransferase [Rhodopirellula sp.]